MKIQWDKTLLFLLLLFIGLATIHTSVLPANGTSDTIQRWQWRSGRLLNSENNPLLLVGSIQKPFVVKAWAETHPGDPAPTITCSTESVCWRVGGHGEMDLALATANSCNAYFLELAKQTPLYAMKQNFKEVGFQGQVSNELSAIGLDPSGPKIRPSSLFKAYSQLITQPWDREDIRKSLVNGLRQAAASGTAALGRSGYYAKTGTIQGNSPNTTIGLAIAIDSSGNGILGRQERATGREVAARLFASTSSKVEGTVRVLLLDLLGGKTVEVQNLEDSAISYNDTFLGAKATRLLKPGDETGTGLLEIRVRSSNFRRRIFGHLRVDPAGKLIATMTTREYASGVINAELMPESPIGLRIELGAAVLRYLKQPPRHTNADVCDNTHCAWFIGRGPRVEWPTPELAKETSHVTVPIDDSLWSAILNRSQSPGPSFWTSHCGGKPLSPYAIWGNGSTEATTCPRHQQPAQRWERAWDRAKLEKSLGGQITSAQIVWPKGQWTLRIEIQSRTRDFNYDATHRLIAPIAGWDGLPSPAESVWLSDAKIHLQGFGSGHRIGLCLGD
jgi:hypothetical protein